MDLLISEVVSDDEDEPLFDISKVVMVVHETQCPDTPKEVRGRPTKYIKICFVPLCPNSSRSTPEKMFITIPINPVRRQQWLDAVGKSSVGRNPKSPMFCCEDHFNLRRDMKNYDEHVKKGKVQMLLYQTVVPSIFICNNYGHLKRNERILVLRKLHEDRNLVLSAQEDEEVQLTYTPRLTSFRQKSIAPKQRKTPEVVQNRPVFIGMPEFEYDQPEIKKDEVDTIVIEDSD